MKELLAKLTFARTMILVCLLASMWLGWKIWGNHQQITQQSAALAPEGRVVELVRDVQMQSERYSQLYESKDSESLKGMADPQSYIVEIAGNAKVAIGLVNIQVSDRDVTNNITDKIYTVRPGRNEDTFGRNQIANFLYKLENDSRRVRITDLTLTALNADGKPRIQPDEYPSDRWTWQFRVTSRQRKGGEPGS